MPIIQAIKPEDRWNMDETGIMEGLGTNGLVLGSSEKKMTLKKHPRSRSWTTIVECILATGIALTPLVIFKGESLQHQWFNHEMEFLQDWNFTASTKGWTDNDIALKWLKEVFIPRSEPSSKGVKRLLILDGHGSHTTDDFFTECYDHDIYILFLPAHSSHVLQPLNIVIFSPLKQDYRAELALFDHQYESAPIAKMNFLYCYGSARQKATIKRNILSGFRATGLWPINSSKALLNRFVTSAPKTPPKKDQATPNKQSRESFKTPRRASQTRSLSTARRALFKANSPTRRLLTRIGERLDQQGTQLTATKHENNVLRSRIERLRPKAKATMIALQTSKISSRRINSSKRYAIHSSDHKRHNKSSSRIYVTSGS